MHRASQVVSLTALLRLGFALALAFVLAPGETSAQVIDEQVVDEQVVDEQVVDEQVVDEQVADEQSIQAVEARRDFEVRIVGNQVLLDPVILGIVDLPEQGPPGEQMAALAEARLERFFKRTGYDLGRARAFVQRDVLWIFVDEGVLEEIFVVGASATRTVNLRLELDLPENVYNSVHVARRIERLEQEHVIRLEAELVQVQRRKPSTAPLERFVASLDGQDYDEAAELWLEQSPRYSLKVTAYSEEWGDGLDFGVSWIGPYGLRVGASFAQTDLLFHADRYSVSAEVGGLSKTLFTSADLELFYAFPEQFNESLRPLVDVDAMIDSFERETLALENYRHIDTSAVLAIGWEPRYDLVFAPGVGYGYDHVFGFARTEQTPAYVENQQRAFFIGELAVEWLVGRVGLRRDKLHLLEAIFEVRSVDRGLWTRFEGDYQKAWEFGYNDLFLRSNFYTFLGDGIEWYDEDPITSQVMRAVAGDEEFAPHLLAVGSEYRLSLHRDVVQAGLSASGAVAGLRDRQSRESYLEIFGAGGPGLHIQLLDNFQLNLFYHLGVRGDGETTGRFSLKFWKIY